MLLPFMCEISNFFQSIEIEFGFVLRNKASEICMFECVCVMNEKDLQNRCLKCFCIVHFAYFTRNSF